MYIYAPAWNHVEPHSSRLHLYLMRCYMLLKKIVLMSSNTHTDKHQSNTLNASIKHKNTKSKTTSASKAENSEQRKQRRTKSDHGKDMHIQKNVTPDTWSHLFHCIVIDKMMVVFIQITVNCNTVTLEQKILQRINTCDAYKNDQHFSIIAH